MIEPIRKCFLLIVVGVFLTVACDNQYRNPKRGFVTTPTDSLKLKYEIGPDTIEYGEEFKAKFKINSSDNRNWMVNITIPRRRYYSKKDTVHYMRLTRQDSLDYYMASIGVKTPGEYHFFVIAECCEESPDKIIRNFPDTFAFYYSGR